MLTYQDYYNLCEPQFRNATNVALCDVNNQIDSLVLERATSFDEAGTLVSEYLNSNVAIIEQLKQVAVQAEMPLDHRTAPVVLFFAAAAANGPWLTPSTTTDLIQLYYRSTDLKGKGKITSAPTASSLSRSDRPQATAPPRSVQNSSGRDMRDETQEKVFESVPPTACGRAAGRRRGRNSFARGATASVSRRVGLPNRVEELAEAAQSTPSALAPHQQSQNATRPGHPHPESETLSDTADMLDTSVAAPETTIGDISMECGTNVMEAQPMGGNTVSDIEMDNFGGDPLTFPEPNCESPSIDAKLEAIQQESTVLGHADAARMEERLRDAHERALDIADAVQAKLRDAMQESLQTLTRTNVVPIQRRLVQLEYQLILACYAKRVDAEQVRQTHRRIMNFMDTERQLHWIMQDEILSRFVPLCIRDLVGARSDTQEWIDRYISHLTLDDVKYISSKWDGVWIGFSDIVPAANFAWIPPLWLYKLRESTVPEGSTGQVLSYLFQVQSAFDTHMNVLKQIAGSIVERSQELALEEANMTISNMPPHTGTVQLNRDHNIEPGSGNASAEMPQQVEAIASSG